MKFYCKLLAVYSWLNYQLLIHILWRSHLFILDVYVSEVFYFLHNNFDLITLAILHLFNLKLNQTQIAVMF